MRIFRHKVYAAIVRPLYTFLRSHFNASPASDGVTNVTLCSLFLSEPPTLVETAALHRNVVDYMKTERVATAFTVFPRILDFHLHEDSIRAFLLEAEALSGGTWDILLLGADAYGGAHQVTRNVTRVSRFRGPTAMIVKRAAAERIVATYHQLVHEGYTPTVDTLYARVFAATQPPLTIFAPPFPNLFCSIRRI